MHTNRVLRAGLAGIALILISLIPTGGANAQLGGGAACNASVAISQSVPVFDQNTQVQKDVKCTWDGLAWQLAHVALHQLTGSVVSWINSGFKGSPSFVSNPEQFFLDLNDQVTGAFIGNSGILAQALCSPFSTNIRLALALGQQNNYNQRYTCTLSKIIQTQTTNLNNLKNGNAVNVTVTQSGGGATLGDYISGAALKNSNQISVNGNSIDNIQQAADKGNWAGLLLMTTEPANNWISASLMARSDLGQQTAARKNSVNNDLNRGNGFLSWQSCNNVRSVSAQSGSLETKQVCTTQTPGSYLNNSLAKATGVSADELNMTNEINQVVSALFSQLLTHTLSNGLLSSSKNKSNKGSYADQLQNDPALQRNFISLQKQVTKQFKDYQTATQKTSMYESQAAGIIASELAQFQAVQACVAATATSTTSFNAVAAQQALPAINSTITNNLLPLATSYASAAQTASSSIAAIADMISQLETATSTQPLSDMANQFSDTLSSSDFSSLPAPQSAKTDVTTANNTVSDLKKDLKSYQSLCGS